MQAAGEDDLLCPARMALSTGLAWPPSWLSFVLEVCLRASTVAVPSSRARTWVVVSWQPYLVKRYQLLSNLVSDSQVAWKLCTHYFLRIHYEQAHPILLRGLPPPMELGVLFRKGGEEKAVTRSQLPETPLR